METSSHQGVLRGRLGRTFSLEWHAIVPKVEVGDAQAVRIRLEPIFGDTAVQDLGLLVDEEDRSLIEVLPCRSGPA